MNVAFFISKKQDSHFSFANLYMRNTINWRFHTGSHHSSLKQLRKDGK
ncbi:hypothetical protein EMIT019CA3_20320 [Bacillus pseudomycoides]|nr:hypothetical protein DJ94_4996 [Bacillus pseudomycoides]